MIGRDQVRNAFIGRQFHHLRVDQDHPDLFRRGPGQQRHQHGVDEAGLTGSGGAGDQQVRHLGQVGRDEVALDVLAEADHQRVVVTAGGRRGEHVGQPHHFAVGVGHLDADGGLAGDRGQHADALGGHRVGDVLLQRGDLLHLDARPQLDLVAGDGGPAGAAGDGRVDLELVEYLADGAGHDVVGGAALLRRVAGDQQGHRPAVRRGPRRPGPAPACPPFWTRRRPRGCRLRQNRSSGTVVRDRGDVVLERGQRRDRPTATPVARRSGANDASS